MEFDALYYPYKSQRMLSYARKGMVCTSQPLAAQAGLDMLKKGGNAIDAAIATAISLTVLEPTSNGIGGDAFALIWTNNRLHGLNASGPAPQALTIEQVKARGFTEMPTYGWLPVTVPGAPKAWAALSERFGKLPFEQLFEPAIHYAEQGFPVSPTLGKYWALAEHNHLAGEEFQPWHDTFTMDGRPPRIGEIWRSPDHARTLREMAETCSASFYEGDLAEQIERHSKKHDGLLRKTDLERYQVEWVDPIHLPYRGYEIWEIPPNGQGLNTLIALNILKGFPAGQIDSVEMVHRQIEAMKLAFADGLHYITDPQDMQVSTEELLSEGYAAQRRGLITDQAAIPSYGTPQQGGTVYLATADEEGNMVSFIQSNYKGFGSGIVIPGTGIAMQNRGNNFSLDPKAANALRPGKKTYHTIIPGFITKAGQPIGPFGVMGAFMQPQGHLQVAMNLLDFQLNPQAALDAPRWMWMKDRVVKVEPQFPDYLAQALERKGHHILKAVDEGVFGRGQIIWRNEENGVLIGATDWRTDGMVAGW